MGVGQYHGWFRGGNALPTPEPGSGTSAASMCLIVDTRKNSKA